MILTPYCGAPPTVETLAGRWNGDPVLIVALAILAILHLLFADRARRPAAAAGWAVTALALLSPLCALSVSLFSARIAQHMILILVAAPLIGGALPTRGPAWSIRASVAAFALALWFWHMPAPYDATFRSSAVYWAMHVSLFGSAIWLWRDLLRHRADRSFDALAGGLVASTQMGLLGAVLTLAGRPLFLWHVATTGAWGLTPLADQQLGGVIMWVPSILLFLWAALRSLGRLWTAIERPAAG